jgi:hypothetical protein
MYSVGNTIYIVQCQLTVIADVIKSLSKSLNTDNEFSAKYKITSIQSTNTQKHNTHVNQSFRNSKEKWQKDASTSICIICINKT